jgi:hypothetical protein
VKIDHWDQVDQDAIRAFYETGQAWTWQEIDEGSSNHDRQIREWIESSPAPRQHPLVLPARRAGETESSWYAIAFSEAQAEELREQLNAFLGPAGSDYQGRRPDLDPADALDASALAWAGAERVFRFAALPEFRSEVRAALERMRRVWYLQPPLRIGALRNTEALLREFFFAIANVDEAATSSWLAELRANGRLSADNLHFLEIERLGAFARWGRIALHPYLSMLLAVQRPRRITALLIEALWRTELAGFATAGGVEEALKYTREQFLPRYANLLRARGSMSQRAVVLTFLLVSAASTPPRREQLATLLAALGPDAPEYAFAQAVVARVAPSEEESLSVQPTGPLQLAQAALEGDDFDTAWTHLAHVSPSVSVCRWQLDCAQELFTPEVAQTVSTAIMSLPSGDRETTLQTKRYRAIWDAIQTLLATPRRIAPIDWETWLDAVDVDPAWSAALEAARNGVSEWSLKVYADQPARVTALNTRLQLSREPDAAKVVRLALPHLLRFFLPDGSGRSEFQPIYADLLLALALDERFGGEDWNTTQTLAWAMLEAGISNAEYESLAEAVTTLWDTRGDSSRLDWALTLLDAFAVTPVLVPTARAAFYTSIWKTFQAHPRRVQAPQREIFRRLSVDLQQVAEFEALPVPDVGEGRISEIDFTEYLQNRIVGIYTLEASAGSRAKSILESLRDNVEVRLNHDHVGSERLRSLAREADYLVVASRSAKHAATDYIKQERPLGLREVIFAAGKGSSSIITALREAILRWS